MNVNDFSYNNSGDIIFPQPSFYYMTLVSRLHYAASYQKIDYLIKLFYNIIVLSKEEIIMGLFVKEDENTKTYFVTVIETLKRKVEVNAASEDEAIAKVEEAYNKCKIVLDESDFTDVKFKIKKVTEIETEEE